MWKKFNFSLFGSEIEKLMACAKVDKSHDPIDPKYLQKIVDETNIPKNKNILLNMLYKNMNSSDRTIKIKSLIILHSCLRKTFDREICEVIMNLDENNVKLYGKDFHEDLNAFIDEKAVKFYVLYLKKMAMHKETFEFLRKTEKLIESNDENKNFENIELVSNGFKIINLSHFILTSKEMFNKMGRYHSNQQEFLSMLLEILEDLTFFNSFLKLSVNFVLSRNKQFQEEINLQKNNNRNLCKNDIEVEVLQPIINPSQKSKQKSLGTYSKCSKKIRAYDFEKLSVEETRHYFLYLNEFQKLSDQLYEFYHNRYFKNKLVGLIIFPTFMVIGNADYHNLKYVTKKVDKNLVELVRISKYEGGKRGKIHSLLTEPSLNISMPDGRNVLTEMGDCHNRSFQEITFSFED